MPDFVRLPAVATMAVRSGEYSVRLAEHVDDLRQAQRLRFQVFHQELGEGLAGACELGRDEDVFDEHCDHLLLVETATDRVVGTYRMQTAERALAGAGFYCDGEFRLDDLPASIVGSAVELGRACIAREHRRGVALFALWRGIAAYLEMHGKRYLFGCCSLTGIDGRKALTAKQWLADKRHEHASVRVAVRPELEASGPSPSAHDLATFELPSLFHTYIRYGARVCGGPAIDRSFGTTDFLVVLDSQELTPRQRALFFSAS